MYATPGQLPKNANLLILLDGNSTYQGRIPATTILDNLFAEHKIGPTIAVFVDNGGPARAVDMNFSDPFVTFLSRELVSWVDRQYGLTVDAQHTVLGGDSVCGLIGAYAAVNTPDVFGHVLAQSGAFQLSNSRDASDAEPEPPHADSSDEHCSARRHRRRFHLALASLGHICCAGTRLADTTRMRSSSLILFGIASLLAGHAAHAQITYRRATIDSAEQLRILLSNGRSMQPPRDSDQVGFGDVAISPDRRIVGWVALYHNCCTSYPIPLQLVLLRADGSRAVIANALPIWKWAFTSGGQRVVLREAPVHGDGPIHYEQRDARTARLIAARDAPSSSSIGLPEWAKLVAPQRSDVRAAPKER